MRRGRRWGAGARLWGSARGKAQAAGGRSFPGRRGWTRGDDAVPPRVPRGSGGACARRDSGGNDRTGVRQSHGAETITRGLGGHTGRDGHTGGRWRDGHAAADNTAARGRRALGRSTAHAASGRVLGDDVAAHGDWGGRQRHPENVQWGSRGRAVSRARCRGCAHLAPLPPRPFVASPGCPIVIFACGGLRCVCRAFAGATGCPGGQWRWQRQRGLIGGVEDGGGRHWRRAEVGGTGDVRRWGWWRAWWWVERKRRHVI